MGIENVTDEQRDEHDDEGITAKLKDGIRLPKSIAEKVAPACVWIVYAIAAYIVLQGISDAISNAVKIVRNEP